MLRKKEKIVIKMTFYLVKRTRHSVQNTLVSQVTNRSTYHCLNLNYNFEQQKNFVIVMNSSALIYAFEQKQGVILVLTTTEY